MNRKINLIVIVIVLISILSLSCKVENLTGTTSNIPSDSSFSSVVNIPLETSSKGAWGTTWDAPIIINQNAEGQTIHVNLIKYVVTAPPKADVTINNIPAFKDIDGSYYVLLDLNPGENSIEVKTTSGSTISLHHTIVTFSPPLFVYLNEPKFDIVNNETDYSKIPVTISGYVSNPQALVKVNGLPVNVNADGIFSIELAGRNTSLPDGGAASLATITATLGNESDSDMLKVFVKDGKLGIMQGLDLTRSSRLDYESLIGIPGKTTQITGRLRVLKDVKPGDIARFDTSKLPSGINITVTPTQFSVYPNINYALPTRIQIGKDVALGNYDSFSLYIGDQFKYGLGVNVKDSN